MYSLSHQLRHPLDFPTLMPVYLAGCRPRLVSQRQIMPATGLSRRGRHQEPLLFQRPGLSQRLPRLEGLSPELPNHHEIHCTIRPVPQ